MQEGKYIMNKVQKFGQKIVRSVIDRATGNGLMQEENTASGERYVTPGIAEKMREVGEESVVLLENDGVLPLADGTVVSVFGRVQNDWFYVGYGSGGDVTPPYEVSLAEGLKNNGISINENLKVVYDDWCAQEDNKADHGWWGHWPYFHPEMPLTDNLVSEASNTSDAAVVIVGRAAGEDRENVLKQGSYYLTDAERDMLAKVTAAFAKVVLILDCGNIMDLSFLAEYRLSAVLFAWQLGQESGNVIGSILSGKVSPSGKLSDTIAKSYTDYPSSSNFGKKEYNNYAEDIYVGYRYFETFAKDRVLYPFGYGLSYTEFTMEPVSFVHEAEKKDHTETGAAVSDRSVQDAIENENSAEDSAANGRSFIKVKVTNTGKTAGKEIVQIYAVQPRGKLSKSARVLAGFQKTGLLQPGESETVTVEIADASLASFDDAGRTGNKSAFVLEAGIYSFLAGNSVDADLGCGSFEIEQTVVTEQCESVCAVDFNKMFDVFAENGSVKPAHASGRDLKARILENLPEEIPYTGDRGIKLADVKSGKNTLDEFVAQLNDKELSDLSHGEGGMGSELGVTGNAGAFAGITEELRAKGIPAIITADGPAGLRIKRYTSLLPCGTAIACTWNPELVEELFEKEGEETVHYGVDVILSPGMNIHRNPLCGRNFEYYSEDPLLSGKTAAAAVRGIQKGGASACPKHFACNNQETNRNHNDSRVSERALREIYLRNFEICVKEGKPQNLMTSYNKINGVWSHYNYDLATTVLRKEWGYEGNIVTDWWMRKSKSPEFPKIRDNAYRVRAQVDVLMPGNMSYSQKKYIFDKKQLETLDQPDGLTRAELQRGAKNVLRFALTRME